MKLREFGPTGVRVPVIGQGTWQMERDDRRSAIAALQRGIELGMVHLDTAELYGQGAVEEQIVREVLKRDRERLFVVSKVMPSNASAKGTVAACEQSLKRLGTDHLDCYLLHWPGGIPLEETIGAFQKLVKAGKIRSWGVSNFDVPELEEALRIAGPDQLACNQVLYHLKERAIEERVLPWCNKRGVAVVGYSPLGAGEFPSATSAGGKVLAKIGKKHEVGARAVALAFLVRKAPLFTIPKTSKVTHVEENAKAGELTLTKDELAEIDAAFPMSARKDLPMI